MEISELRTKTKTELQEELIAALREQFNLRIQKGTNPQKVKSHAFKNVRRYLARIKTLMHQKANSL